MKIGTSTVTAIYLGTTSIVSAYLGSTQVFGGTSAFTPLSLFSSGSQGIWLDPSDLSTMFSDRAGTTPVTAPGQLVGLRLDKSKGLVLGAELTSGNWANSSAIPFDVFSSSGTSFSATKSTTGTVQQAYLGSFPIADGKCYLVEIVISANTLSTGTRIDFSTTTTSRSSLLPIVSGASTVRGYIYPTSTQAAASFRLYTASSATGSITVASATVRELPGNHAVAPTDAARPMYGVEPKGGRRNLLLATDTLATQSLTVTAVAHTLAFTGTGTVTLTGASIAGPLVGTGAGDRVSLTFTPTAASLTLTVSGSVTLGQLELGSSATAYQKVVTAYNVTESGVATCHYVQYDGSDDSISTAAIDFTGTDKMSVFAGVRKLSDAAAGMLMELSVNYNTNTGSFYITAPENTGASGNYASASRGAAGSNVNQTAKSAVILAPISSLLTVTNDIAGDLSAIRVNGVASGTNGTADKGTGNFRNDSLYIGRRGGASLPFNGKDYGIVIVGKAASAGEISDTETWLAAKTSGVTI